LCGFAGFISNNLIESQSRNNILKMMGQSLLHRGPDQRGEFNYSERGFSLVHQRLSILDTSENGKQPMISPSGRFVIAFNGEIYNYKDLKSEIQKSDFYINDWSSDSDTEVLLRSIEIWGLERTLSKIVGMFSFALLDMENDDLFLARDRIGEKPLYYGCQKGSFIFGSELKALKVHSDFENIIDRNSITLQLRFSSIPAPFSIYKGVRKLLPGTYIKLSLANNNFQIENIPSPIPYWKLSNIISEGRKNVFLGSDNEAIGQLDKLLNKSIEQQMLSDVPLGAFLSGGVDSSSIVAIMQAQSDKPIKTFTIGSDDQSYNEAKLAKLIAEYLQTDHTELYVSAQDALNIIPYLPKLYDEPFSDFSQIPTSIVSKLAKKQVTVSLSGDAGDELFGGYNRYIGVDNWWSKINSMPFWLRRFVGSKILSISPLKWESFEVFSSKVFFNRFPLGGLGNKMQKVGSVLGIRDDSELYNHFVSNWSFPEEVVLKGIEPIIPNISNEIDFDNITSKMMAMDTMQYLPDDILVKLDRAAMGESLETRVPFLDHRIIEFAWTLPLSMKIRSGQGKWILRQLLNKYVPNKLTERPKTGFNLPIDKWLRGPLKDWAEDLLDEKRLISEGYLNPIPIRQKWEEHISGKYNWQHQLWDVLMFQAWLKEQSL
jgi:asparagine synthase (glutamine-hydrolysing)